MTRSRRLPPGIRQLPSGKYQATVRGPDGRRHTDTFDLQRAAVAWRDAQKVKIAEGRWRDPRAGNIAFDKWAEKWFKARVAEPSTLRIDRGVLNNHILPKWRNWRLNTINPLDVQNWIREMQHSGVRPPTIRRVYILFRTILGDAVTADVLAESPCQKRKVTLPPTPPKLPAWFTRDQIDAIRAELERGTARQRPRPHIGHSVMVELMVCSGPRWGEAAALCGQERPDGNPVDWLRGKAKLIGALDQFGRWKPYPKTSKSRREIPLPPHVVEAMGELLRDREPDDYVFVTGRQGKPLSGANWRVVWYAALDAANERIAAENRRRPKGAALIPPIPRLDVHDCRHTAASWLVQAGVPLYDVQALLGHSSMQVTQRYAHLAPDRHDPIEKAWKAILAHVWRTERPGAIESVD